MKKRLVLIFGFLVVVYPFGLILFSGILFKYDSHFKIEGSSNKNPKIQFLEERPRTWTRLVGVSSKAVWPIIISEDWAFYNHSGIDLKQLFIVLEESAEEGKFVRGASTITQQVVKNLYLSHERSIFRKLNEMILAVTLEFFASKKWILEQYINLAEFGPKVYGIKEASQYYFKKSPSSLSYREGAFLAMLLPSPVRYGESFRKSELTEFAMKQIESILEKLVKAKIITEEEKELELMQTFDWEALPENDYFFP